MTATEILTELRCWGVELVAVGDRLRYRPKDALSPELRQALVRHKAEVIRLLSSVSESQTRKSKARIRGQENIVETTKAEVCWHCKGGKRCRCAFCAVRGTALRREPGPCGACLATGFLTWPETVQ